MRHITTVAELYSALQPILGLPDRCVSFELSMRAGDMGVMVTCEHYVALDAPGLKQFESVLSEYELVRKPASAPDENRDAAEVHVVDFDVWMRDRIERAHIDYMTRTAKLSTIAAHAASLGRAQ